MKKILGIFICVLLIGTTIPVMGNTVKEKSTISNDENNIMIYLPDVHITYYKNRFKWARVEFDDPGKTIYVDLSEFNLNDKIIFNQTIYCHPYDVTKTHMIAAEIDNSEFTHTCQGGLMFFNEDNDWKLYHYSHIKLNKIVEGNYRIIIDIAGIPELFKIPFMFYWQFIYFPQWTFGNVFPCPLIERYGNIVQYSLDVYT